MFVCVCVCILVSASARKCTREKGEVSSPRCMRFATHERIDGHEKTNVAGCSWITGPARDNAVKQSLVGLGDGMGKCDNSQETTAPLTDKVNVID